MLKAIMFDLDDTLLWDHKSVQEALKTTCEKAVKSYNVDSKLLSEKVGQYAKKFYPEYETYDFVKDIGIGFFEAMWGEFKDKGDNFKKLREMTPSFRKRVWYHALLDMDVDDEQLAEELAVLFPEERKKHIYLFEETLDVLDKLQDEYQLLMLTNGSPDLQKTKLALSPELAPYFDHIVISGEFGTGKPNEAIFNHALDLLQVKKCETIMIGDNTTTDILGASKTGIDSIWINLKIREKTDIVPTYEVDRLKEILPIIKSLSKEA